MGGDTGSPAAKQRTAERDKQILELRLRGATFEMIAGRLGMHAKGVSKAYYRELANIPRPEREQLRKEHKERLERAWRVVWAKFEAATDSHEIAMLNREVARLEEREARLFGLDAPQKLDVYSSVTVDQDKKIARLE
jgi:hypothetical protein